ncbi:MAG: AsmA family protein [Hyphomicrobiales bacterium]|nr:AsmA family protein [Hyphomicrobiales bacterium]
MRWRLAIVALVLGAFVAGLLPYRLAAPQASANLRQLIARNGGLTADFAEGATLRLLPWPSLRFRDLVIRKAGRIKLRAAAIEVPLAARWLRLLQPARLEARLIRPQFAFNLDDLTPGVVRAGAAPALQPLPALGAVRIDFRDARITLKGSHLRWPLVLDHVTGSYDAGGAGAPVALRFGGTAAHGEISGRMWLGRQRQEWRAFDLVLKGPWAQVATSGYWHGRRYQGHLAFASRSPRWMTPFHGPIVRALQKIGDLSFAADVGLQRGQIEAAHVRGTVNGQQFRGLLALDRRGAADKLSGTLAARHWQLPDMLLAGAAPRAGLAPTLADGLNGRALDLDLRASVLQLVWHHVNIRNLALALTTDGGPMKFEIAQAEIGGGTVRGALKLASNGTGAPLRAALHLNGVDIAALCRAMICPEPLSGRLSADINMQTTPDPTRPLVSTLTGGATFSLQDGALPGPDLGRWLRWQARSQGSLLPLLNTDGTVFHLLRGHIDFAAQKPAQLTMSLGSSALSATAQGTLDPASMSLDLKASARQIRQDSASTAAQARLAFSIKGPLTHPRLTPTMVEAR